MRGIEFLKYYRCHKDEFLPMVSEQYRSFKDAVENEGGTLYNIGWNCGLVGKNRPFFSELWEQKDITTYTVFISSKEIEDYTPEQIDALCEDNSVYKKNAAAKLPDVDSFTDSDGNAFFSVNLCVRTENGSCLVENMPEYNRFYQLNELNDPNLNEQTEAYLTALGYTFKTENELGWFLKSVIRITGENAKGIRTKAKLCNSTELWYSNDGKPDFKRLKVHVSFPTRTNVRFDHWEKVRDESQSSLAYVWNPNYEYEFPMNLDVVNAGFFDELTEGAEYAVQITGFAEKIECFTAEEDFTAKTNMARESCIPCGTFSPDKDNQSAYVILAGTVLEAEKCVNNITKKEFYRITVKCLGLKLDIIVSDSILEKRPKTGETVYGMFYLSAKLFTTNNTDKIEQLAAVDTKAIIDEWGQYDIADDGYTDPRTGWTLDSYNMSQKDSFSALFSSTDEVEGDDIFHHFLRFDNDGKITERRRMYNDEYVIYCFYDKDEHCRMIVSPNGYEESFVYDTEEEGGFMHMVAKGLAHIVTDSDGNIAVGSRSDTNGERSDRIFTVYDKNGKILYEYDRDDLISCNSLTVDGKGNFYFTALPDNALFFVEKQSDGKYLLKTKNFPLSGISGMSVSDDGNVIIVEYLVTPDKSRFYITEYGEEHGWGKPRPVVLPFDDGLGKPKICGKARMAGDRFIVYTDGVLYLFKVKSANEIFKLYEESSQDYSYNKTVSVLITPDGGLSVDIDEFGDDLKSHFGSESYEIHFTFDKQNAEKLRKIIGGGKLSLKQALIREYSGKNKIFFTGEFIELCDKNDIKYKYIAF